MRLFIVALFALLLLVTVTLATKTRHNSVDEPNFCWKQLKQCKDECPAGNRCHCVRLFLRCRRSIVPVEAVVPEFDGDAVRRTYRATGKR